MRDGFARRRTLAQSLVGYGLVGALLSGCASSRAELSEPPVALSAAEQSWHCGALENALEAKITKIKALTAQAQAERDRPSPTLSGLMAQILGQSSAEELTLAQIKSEQETAQAHIAAMHTKACNSSEIEARYSAATGAS